MLLTAREIDFENFHDVSSERLFLDPLSEMMEISGTDKTAEISNQLTGGIHMAKSKTFRCLSKEEALRVLCAALAGGALKLPLTEQLNKQDLNKFVDACAGRNVTDGCELGAVYDKALTFHSSEKAAAFARADAMYLLAFLDALENGLTEEETERIIRTTFG